MGTSLSSVLLAKETLLSRLEKITVCVHPVSSQFGAYDPSIINKQLTTKNTISNLVYCLTEQLIL
jgi:hypothetical protein